MENQIQRVLDAADLRLKINQVLCDSVDIVAVVGYIMDHKLVIQQLRTNSKLLVGLVHIFSATVRFVLLGLNYPRHGFSNIPGANIRENPFSRASSHTMSMPETFALDEIHLPTEGNSCNEEDRHVASHDKITLKDPPPPMPSSTCLQFKDLPWLDLIADKTKEGGRHEEEGSGVPLDSATTIDPLEYKKWPDDLVDIKDMRNATATIPSAVFKKSVFTGQCDELSNVHNHIHVRSRSLNYPPSSAEHIVDGTNTFPSGNVTDEANEIVDREDSHVGSDTGSELSTEPQVTAPPVLSNNEGRQQPHEEEGSGVPLDSATTLDPRVYKKWLEDPADIKEMRNATDTIPSVVFEKSVFTGQCDELSNVHNHIHVRSRSLNYPPISAEHVVDGSSTFPSGNVTDEADEIVYENDAHVGWDTPSKLSTELPQDTATPVRFSAALRSLLDREPNIPSMSQETSTNSLQFTQRASAVIECFKEYAAYHRLSKKLINLSELLKDEPRRVCAVMLIEVLELLCSDYLTVEFDSSAVRNPLIIYDIMLRPTKKLTRLILFET